MARSPAGSQHCSDGEVGVRAGVSKRRRLWVSAQHVFSMHRLGWRLYGCPWLGMSPEISHTPTEERGQVASRDSSPGGPALHSCPVLQGSRRGALKLCSSSQPRAPWR